LNKVFHKYMLFFAIFFSSLFVQGKEVIVGVGNFEPFFNKETKSGLFIDLVKEMFKLMPGYEPTFIFLSNSRLLVEIESDSRNIDVACNIFKNAATNSFLSTPFFRYTDVAISLKSKNFIINNISDLENKSIIAYQGATDLLSPEFRAMAKKNPKYSEDSIPMTTTKKMVRGVVDVRVGDVFIFLHNLNVLRKKNKITQNIQDFNIHYLWRDVFSHIAFKDEDLRDLANEAIRKLKLNGTYSKVYKKYESIFTQKNMLPPRM